MKPLIWLIVWRKTLLIFLFLMSLMYFCRENWILCFKTIFYIFHLDKSFTRDQVSKTVLLYYNSEMHPVSWFSFGWSLLAFCKSASSRSEQEQIGQLQTKSGWFCQSLIIFLIFFWWVKHYRRLDSFWRFCGFQWQ